MRSPTTRAELEAAFSDLFPLSFIRQHASVGVSVQDALSPGDLNFNPVDEAHGLVSAAALQARGWPLSADEAGALDPDNIRVFRYVPVLPWLGYLPPGEGAPMLGISGFERALQVAAEPEAAAPMWGCPWRAGIRLSPGDWLAASITLLSPPGPDGEGTDGGMYLGVQRLRGDPRLAFVVLPYSEPGRLGLRRLLGLTDEELQGALEDEIRGRFD
ncbi:MAG: hypothetical protein AAFV53_07805 [Myxococcota bacterium]